MAFEKFRAFMDLGRVQGVSTTAAIMLLGAFTSTAAPSGRTILLLVLIAAAAHAGGAAVNELCDRRLDAELAELARKPMVSGSLSVREAGTFIAACALASGLASLFLFGPAALAVLLLGFLWLAFYCKVGKRIPFVYDLAFSVSYPCLALFGALAAGRPTFLSGVFVGIVAAVSAFSQWENSLKDADNDRRFGLQSLAVRWGVSSENGIGPADRFFIWGAIIKAVFLIVCIIPIFLMKVPMAYFIVVVMLGIPDQVLTMKMFLGKKARTDYVKLILVDVPASWLVGSAVALIVSGWRLYIGLAIFLVAGYLAGSALQSGAEFKFRRYSRPAAREAPAGRDGRLYIKGNPILMSWIARVTHR